MHLTRKFVQHIAILCMADGGFIYCAIRTRGFRERPIMIDFSES
jgi:hypothetical protein